MSKNSPKLAEHAGQNSVAVTVSENYVPSDKTKCRFCCVAWQGILFLPLNYILRCIKHFH